MAEITNNSPHPLVIFRECVQKHHVNSSLDSIGCKEFQPKAKPDDLHCRVCGCEREHHRQIVVAPGATCNISGAAPPPPPMKAPPSIGTISGSDYRKLMSEQRERAIKNAPPWLFPDRAAPTGSSADPNAVPPPPPQNLAKGKKQAKGKKKN